MLVEGGAQIQGECRVLGGLGEAAGTAPCHTQQGTLQDAPGRCRAASGRQGALRSRGPLVPGCQGTHLGRWGRPRGGRGSRGGAQVRLTRARGGGGCGMLSLYGEQDRAHRIASPRLFGTERGEPSRSGRTSLGVSGTGAAARPGGFSDTVLAVGAGISPGLPPGGWDAGTPSQVNPGPARSLASAHAVARDAELGRQAFLGYSVSGTLGGPGQCLASSPRPGSVQALVRLDRDCSFHPLECFLWGDCGCKKKQTLESGVVGFSLAASADMTSATAQRAIALCQGWQGLSGRPGGVRAPLPEPEA